jgi:hypothetical protein
MKGLIFRTINYSGPVEGEWFDREIWGAKLRFQVRPRTDALVEKIRENHKKQVGGREVYDEDAISDELNDYLFQDFEGFGGEELADGSVRSFERTLADKKKILYMSVPYGQQPNAVWLLDRANQQGFRIQQEEKGN